MIQNTRWQPLVERGYDPKPERDGIDFALTPGERSKAAQYSVAIERNRRQQNRRDEARVLGVAGTRV
jgi:hypothetical protein